MVFYVKNNYPSVSQIPASIVPLVFHTPNNYPGVFPTSASGGIGFSYFRGNFRPAEAECRHFRVTVVTSSRRRPPCWAVSCRASLGIQHVQLVQCRVVLGHRNATSVPCPRPRAAPSLVFRAVTIALCRAVHGHRNATSAPCPRRARARLPRHLRSLAGVLEKGPIIEGVRGSIKRGRTSDICRRNVVISV